MSGHSDGFMGMCAFRDFILVLLSFLDFDVCGRLSGVDLAEFVEMHPNIAEDGNKTLLCGNRQQFYFWLSPGVHNNLYFLYSWTFFKPQWILWTFLHLSSVACLVLNPLTSDILASALHQKLPFVFSELPTMGWTIQNQSISSSNKLCLERFLSVNCWCHPRPLSIFHSFDDVNVGLKIHMIIST